MSFYYQWWDYDYSTKTVTIHPHELNFDVDKNSSGWPWQGNFWTIKNFVIENGVTAKGPLELLFQNVEENIVGLNNLDTSQVTSMREMFIGSYFKELDLSTFDTSNVTGMSEMFKYCPFLKN